MDEVRKLQVFDAMKRFGGVARLESEKLRQAKEILKQRKLLRVMVSWQVHMV